MIRDRIALYSFLRDVPGPDSILWSLNPGHKTQLGVNMEIIPRDPHIAMWGRRDWEWRVVLTYDGTPGMICYASGSGSWRRPRPGELRGRCKGAIEAAMRARAVADRVRARHAEVKNVDMRRHKERLPLS